MSSRDKRKGFVSLTKSINLLVLLAALTLSFGLRYFQAFHYAGFNAVWEGIGGDAEEYLNLGYVFSQTGRIARPANLDLKHAYLNNQLPTTVPLDLQYTAWRPPLWPIVLGIIERLSGYNPKTIFYLRFLLDSITVLLFYRLLTFTGIHSITKTVGLLLFAAHPAWLIYSITLLSEPLTLLLQIALAVSMFELSLNKTSLVRAGVVGALSGLCILAHPYYLLLPLILVGCFYARKLISARQTFVVVTVMALIIAPWVFRNMLLFHTAKPILTTSAGINVVKGWNSGFLGAYRNTTADVVLDENADAGSVDLSSFNEADRSDFYLGLSTRFIRTNWRLVPAILARKFIGAVNPIMETPRYGILEAGRSLFQILCFLPLILVLAAKRFGTFRLLVISVSLAYLVMALVTIPTIRYRFPLIWIELICLLTWADLLVKRFIGRGIRMRRT
jgi:hypothetical protein